MATIPDPDGWVPDEFPFWSRDGAPPQHAPVDRKGNALRFWRNLTYHCGDGFANWVLEVLAKREDPWALLRAVDAVLESDPGGFAMFGDEARTAVATLLAPDVPPEPLDLAITDFYAGKNRG